MKKLLKVVKQTRNDPGRRPSQGSNSFFLHMQKVQFFKISSILQSQNVPQGIRRRLENYLFLNCRGQNLSKN